MLNFFVAFVYHPTPGIQLHFTTDSFNIDFTTMSPNEI